MAVSTPLPSSMLKLAAVAARWSLGLLLAAWLVFALAWGALHFLIVPRIDELRPLLEARGSRLLGLSLRIGGISAQSDGRTPSFELTDLRLFDTQGREALHLPRVLAALSPRSLLGLRFEQLAIDRPQLDIRRTAQGKLLVAGLELAASPGADSPLLDWFFSQPDLSIHQGSLQWTDDLRGAAPLMLQNVNFVARNQGRTHSLRLDASPPPEWGLPFQLMAILRQPLLSGSNGRWREWDGQLYAAFERMDVSRLRQYADVGVGVARGYGSARAWADIRQGAVTGVTADVALAEVTVALAPDLEPLRLGSVTGRLGGRMDLGGFEFSTQSLQFDTQDGLHWPGGNVRLVHDFGDTTAVGAGRASRTELVADRLDLAALGQIAHRLPLGNAVHSALRTYAPQGMVERVSAQWRGPLEAPVQFEARGRVSQLAVLADAVRASPGVSGASLDFDLTLAGGTANIAIANGALVLPGVFEEPVLPLTQFASEVQWQVKDGRWSVQLGRTRFSNADAQGELQGTWHTSDPALSASRSRFPGVLDLKGTLSRGDGARVHRYLPLLLAQDARDYVRQAVVKGSMSDVRFTVRGDLYDMPFTDPKRGEFRISTQMQDATFAYVPRSLQPAGALPWPALTGLSGELVIDRASLQLKGVRASMGALQLTRAEGLIADLEKASVVVVNADARGPLADMLDVVSSSPLADLTAQALAQTQASGMADLRLKLTLPLANIDNATAQGSVVLAGADVQFAPGTPRLTRARGTVNFSGQGFSLAGVQARLLGGDARIEGGSVPGAGSMAPSVLLRAQGSVTAEGLRQASELGMVVPLARRLSGTAAYSAVLGFRQGHPELQVSSSLAGMALNLPAPLNKSAETALPFRLETVLRPESLVPDAAGRLRLQDQLRMELGRIAVVAYDRDLSGAQPQVLRGGIGIGLLPGESVPAPAQGVVANLSMVTLDADAWTSLAAPWADALGEAGDAQAYMPTRLALRAQELTVRGRKLTNVVAGGSREGTTWRASVDAAELNGYLEYRLANGPNSARMYARLARLTLLPGAARDVEALLDEQPATMPALDIVVGELELRGKKLGRLEIDAVNRAPVGAGGTREWRLNAFNLTTPEATLTASGNWVSLNAQGPAAGGVRTAAAAPAERRRTVMNFKLDIADAGELLARLGMKDVVRRGKGRMEGQVSWVGSPITLDYPTMAGAFTVNVDNGQFLKADPGLAKLLGVLSLQSLPRRLALDFRDVFSEGFAFDVLRGDVAIQAGMASTSNLQMKGVNAAVLMEGRADLARETQNLRVVVIPEINAGTASLIASAINPAVALGSFLAQYILRRPLMEAATQEFLIEGTWTDPKVSKVERKSPS